MDDILISIIIPTYKRNDNLKRAIESALNQKGKFEIIVVDDNDSNTQYREKNEAFMEKYNNNPIVKYIKHDKNKNGAAARNTGIKYAKGKYITFLDDDDEFSANRIESIEEILVKGNVDFICTGIEIKKNGSLECRIMPDLNNKKNKDIIYDLLCQKSFFQSGSNIICKKNIVDQINGFDERFIRHQDMEFVIRVLELTDKVNIVKNYSVTKNNDDGSNVPSFEKMLNVKKMYLDKFDYLIKDYTSNEIKKIYETNYYQLLKNAYHKKDKQDVKKCKEFIKREGYYKYTKDIVIFLKIKLKRIKAIKNIRTMLTCLIHK